MRTIFVLITAGMKFDLREIFRYTYHPPAPRRVVLVDAGWADEIPDHIKCCRPPYFLEMIEPSEVLRGLWRAGWFFGADFQGELQAIKGRDLVVLKPGAQAVCGVISEADVRYVDAYLLIASTEREDE